LQQQRIYIYRHPRQTSSIQRPEEAEAEQRELERADERGRGKRYVSRSELSVLVLGIGRREGAARRYRLVVDVP